MQTPEGIVKTKKTMIDRYGLTEDGKSAFHVRVGAIGGQNGNTGGFAANHELAREAGRKGGQISKRGKAKPYIGN